MAVECIIDGLRLAGSSGDTLQICKSNEWRLEIEVYLVLSGVGKRLLGLIDRPIVFFRLEIYPCSIASGVAVLEEKPVFHGRQILVEPIPSSGIVRMHKRINIGCMKSTVKCLMLEQMSIFLKKMTKLCGN